MNLLLAFVYTLEFMRLKKIKRNSNHLIKAQKPVLVFVVNVVHNDIVNDIINNKAFSTDNGTNDKHVQIPIIRTIEDFKHESDP